MILTGGLIFLSLITSGLTVPVVPGTPTPLVHCSVPFLNEDVFSFSQDPSPPSGKVSRCTGEMLFEGGEGVHQLCGTVTNELAERFCWEQGINLDMSRSRRLFKCTPSTGAALNNIDSYYYQRGTDFDVGKANCPHFFCTQTCTGGIFGASPLGGSPASDCAGPGGATVFPAGVAAVACEDRDECVEGALVNCHGGEDDDCLLVKACAHYTICENTVAGQDGGYSCECLDGFYAYDDVDKYNPGGAGCLDIDECALGTHNCFPDACENTKGSYRCICDRQQDFVYNATDTDKCEDFACDTITFYTSDRSEHIVPAAQHGDTAIIPCAHGYQPSEPDYYGNPDEIMVTCKNQKWQAPLSPRCVPKPCGDPGSDGNAGHNATLGYQNDVVKYECLPGFHYEYDVDSYVDYYERECDDGSWSNPTAKCVDKDECEKGEDDCDENAVCKNTIGGHICICNPGYTENGTECEEVECEAPLSFTNAVRQHSYVQSYVSTSYGQRVDYQCKEGYRAFYPTYLSPDLQRQSRTSSQSFSLYCSKEGIWQPQPVTDCVPVRCPDPGVISLTSRSESSFEYGKTVTFTCPPGFHSSTDGDSSFYVKCEEDGTWSKAADCVDVDECAQSNPCNKDGEKKHLCINLKGSFTCSCEWGYRLDSSGKACIQQALPSYYSNWKAAPCDMYEGLKLCDRGSCQVDSNSYPYCECVDGYTGAFCSVPPHYASSKAIAGLAIACVSLALVLIILMCCICHPQPNDSAMNTVSPPLPPSYYGQLPRTRTHFVGSRFKPCYKI